MLFRPPPDGFPVVLGQPPFPPLPLLPLPPEPLPLAGFPPPPFPPELPLLIESAFTLLVARCDARKNVPGTTRRGTRDPVADFVTTQSIVAGSRSMGPERDRSR